MSVNYLKQTQTKGLGTVGAIRCLTVWVTATSLTGALLAWLLPAVALGISGPPASFEQLLVACCALAGAGCVGWLWLLVTLVVADAGRGRPARAGVPPVVRRIVLGLCGLSLAGGLATPAHADHAPGPKTASATESLLVGLPLPDRATSTTTWLGSLGAVARSRPVESPPPSPRPDSIRVQPGDTLWELAGASLPADAGPEEIDRRWRRIYRANRDAIGADPDLIRPGQRLLLPHPRVGHR